MACGAAPPSQTAAQSPVFDGAKGDWHGFDRYDFLMDEQTLAIKPADAGVRGNVRGQRRCIVVTPKTAAPGNPWSWRGCYWDHQPQTEVELLRRGFHIAYITADASLRPDKKWDAWYAFLAEKHGLSRKPCFVGMSRGGEFEFIWATLHPDQVSCIYADNPGANPGIFERLAALARADVPVIQVCGSIDPLLGRNALAIENIYQQFGGRMTMLIKDGAGHHPHSLNDPTFLADFIERSVRDVTRTPPSFVGSRAVRTSFYSIENFYREFPREPARITCRGASFVECYDRYQFDLGGVEAGVNVIVPKIAAAGKPWVYRAGFVERDAVVDLALLAKGFHIVTGPVGYNYDGPQTAQWDTVYKHLVSHGFSPKPVMEGAGAAAGEVYVWAIANPDKVACVYAENPVLHSNVARRQPLSNLAPLAKAGVPLLHVCGSNDPWLETQTRVAEKRYKELGGQITIIVQEGRGHYPLGPKDPKPVVDFIVGRTPVGADKL
jgi:pimeloyl-ACP methyl ester carboxylesterase